MTCSLSINVARGDGLYIRQTIPALVKACRFDFLERSIIMETAPPTPRYAARPGLPSQEALEACCQWLVGQGCIDTVRPVDYSPERRDPILKKYFGRVLKQTHDYRGGAIYPYLFAIEDLPGDYIAHFDGDMMMHQREDSDWIKRGIELMEDHEDIVCVCPHPGPPVSGGNLKQRGVPYRIDKRGFYAFKRLTTRRFLLHRKRFEALLPLRPHSPSKREWLKGVLGKGSGMQTLEMMIEERLGQTNLIRADLLDGGAWTLHPPEHTPEFFEKLPEILERVERGEFPRGQEGDYDLQVEFW